MGTWWYLLIVKSGVYHGTRVLISPNLGFLKSELLWFLPVVFLHSLEGIF